MRISLLTCSPGEELYSTFGHSALRVTDTVIGSDIVYNYGTFNFDEPGFYMKFVRGKLLYYLSTEEFQDFAELYRIQNRSIIEQVLNLSCSEKQTLIDALNKNMLPENRAYKYDFLFDNCTTRLRDMVEKVSAGTVIYPKIVEENTRFRELIHVYLDNNEQHWSKFGIDLLLGSKTDAVMTNRQAMFLPDYLLKGFDSSKTGNGNLVSSKSVLFTASTSTSKTNLFDYPLFYTSLLFIVVVFLSFSKNEKVISIVRNFDSMFFFIIGVLGTIMLLMWFATDHVMCRNNYNLLWALPTHAIVAFFLNSRKNGVKQYLMVTIILNLLVLIAWSFLPQDLHEAVVPLILLLMFRSWVRKKER